MADLILIRHSISRREPTLSAHQWMLTEKGRTRCLRLAAQLDRYQPDVVVTSAEPKAAETGRLVAQVLDLPLETEPGLHEQRRQTAPYTSDEAFRASIRALLTRPDELVFGEETGTVACDRFEAAVQSLLGRHPGKTVAAVTHGTVMTLFLARAAGVDPVIFWQSLGMPGYVVLRLPDYQMVEIVPEVT